VRELEQTIMKIKTDEPKMRKEITKLINKNVLFDSHEYFIKENKVLCCNFQTDQLQEKLTLSGQYYANVVESFAGDILTVVGGQSKSQTNKQYELLNSVQDFVIDQKNNKLTPLRQT
jgi:hypothetical protein